MKIKATFLVFLVSLLSHSAFAGSNCDSLIAEVFNVIKLKHNYEELVMYQQKKETWSPYFLKSALEAVSLNKIDMKRQAVSLKEYKDKIINVKLNKRTYINCIERELANKNGSNKLLIIPYNFIDPLSSFIDKESIMNRLDFLKIFTHFIFDLDNDTLPPLKDAVEYLKKS